MNTLPDARQALTTAQEYDMLRGMTAAGGGVALILGALSPQPALVAVYVALATAISETWYRRRFGRVKMSGARTAAGIVVSVLLGAAIVVAHGLDHSRQWPVLVAPLVTGACLAAGLSLGLRRVGLTAVHWASCAGLAALSLAPLVGVRGDGGPINLVWAVGTGAALITVGVSDHRRLMRRLGTDVD